MCLTSVFSVEVEIYMELCFFFTRVATDGFRYGHDGLVKYFYGTR